jgi:phosphoribosylformylglycinamidine synthase
MYYRITVIPTESGAAAAPAIVRDAAALGMAGLRSAETHTLYFVRGDLNPGQLDRLCATLFADPAIEVAQWEAVDGEPACERPADAWVVEVGLRPGVTDPVANQITATAASLGIAGVQAATGRRYTLRGDLGEADAHLAARRLLCNETIQHYYVGPMRPAFPQPAAAVHGAERIALAGLSDEELLALSRRRLLALNLDEMRAIRDYFAEQGRAPTDVELETLAQTWSEHCVHKTFRARIELQGDGRPAQVIDGLLRSTIRAATERVAKPWVRSAFVDNAGIIDFDDEYEVSFKVETHNHPSALEPFGGANTGVGGVVRDIIGVSARPIACTDVLCFGPQDLPIGAVPEGSLHPRRIKAGVVSGVEDYGNKLGLPTVSGAILYDESFTSNPLVFVGCLGIAPKGAHPTGARAGNLVVVIGGRTGRDGLHGATFSSEALTHETGEIAGSAVQIGDPIVEKDVLEVVCLARDQRLYSAITDCGAGGLSSAVGELGKDLGVDVELSEVPLKYPGLAPWEIWLSEAQERMVLAVPQEHWPALRELCRQWDVSATSIGHFSGGGRLVVRYGGESVADLTMHFLHEGLPRCTLPARLPSAGAQPARRGARPPLSLRQALLALLAHPNIASKEEIIRRYDHEVGGGTLVKPLTGAQHDGPSDAVVLKPMQTWKHPRGLVLSLGVNPELGKADPYAMALSVVDEALRNAVAVGADPDQVALLDNFCWGNPRRPEQLGGLTRAAQGCYDAAVAYGAPFISGKDSLNNEYLGPAGERVPIPGTLLISALGIIPDVRQAVSMDLKAAGDAVYLVGVTRPDLTGSYYARLADVRPDASGLPALPAGGLATYRALHRAMRAGLIRACHDLSEGGLAVAAAEMCSAGRLGLTLRLAEMTTAGELDDATRLFSESNGRFLVEVAPADEAAFHAALGNVALTRIGVAGGTELRMVGRAGEDLCALSVAELTAAWKGSADADGAPAQAR